MHARKGEREGRLICEEAIAHRKNIERPNGTDIYLYTHRNRYTGRVIRETVGDKSFGSASAGCRLVYIASKPLRNANHFT